MPDPQPIGNVFAQGSVAALPAAFVLGLLATFTPSTFSLAPVIVGYVGAGARSRVAAWGRAFAFLAGLAVVNVGVGAFFGAAGALAQQLVGGNLALWNALAGPVTLLTGLAALGRIPLPLPALGLTSNPTGTWQGAFLLGLPFGLVTCPTCVPLLVPLALGAAVTRLAWYGGLFFVEAVRWMFWQTLM